jgi:AcrR family transcriptional regulator
MTMGQSGLENVKGATVGIVERKEREKTERRNAILASAEELFFRNGYEKTRMLEIAHHCELSKGTLYLYFHNKEDLAKAVVIGAYDLLLEMLEANVSRAETGLERVKAMLQSLFSIYEEHYRTFYLSFVLESHLQRYLVDDRTWPERTERLSRIHHLAASALRQGTRDGTVRDDVNPELAAITAMTAAEGFVHRVFLHGDHIASNRYPADTLVREFISIMINSVT